MMHLLQCLGAKPALGLVVDPLKREIVLRLRDHAQIGESVADFRSLIKAKSANNPVIDPNLDEAVFKFARLILRSYQDGDLIQRRAFALQPFDLFADAARFFGCVPDTDNADLVAAIRLGPKCLFGSVRIRADQACAGAQDEGRGAVVLFLPHHVGAGELLPIVHDMCDSGVQA